MTAAQTRSRGRPGVRARRRSSCALAVVLLLGACSGGDDGRDVAGPTAPVATGASTADPSTDVTPEPSGTRSPSTSPPKATPRICPDRAGDNAARLDLDADLEGDGKEDTILTTGGIGTFDVRFSRGGSTRLTVGRGRVSLLNVEADGEPADDELLAVAGDPPPAQATPRRGRTTVAAVVDLVDCDLRIARNRSGQRYLFEVGEDENGVLHGVHCADRDGDGKTDRTDTSELVGTTATPIEGGTAYRVSSIPVTVHDGRASNGPAETAGVSANAANRSSLSGIDCQGRRPVALKNGAG